MHEGISQGRRGSAGTLGCVHQRTNATHRWVSRYAVHTRPPPPAIHGRIGSLPRNELLPGDSYANDCTPCPSTWRAYPVCRPCKPILLLKREPSHFIDVHGSSGGYGSPRSMQRLFGKNGRRGLRWTLFTHFIGESVEMMASGGEITTMFKTCGISCRNLRYGRVFHSRRPRKLGSLLLYPIYTSIRITTPLYTTFNRPEIPDRKSKSYEST